MHFHMLYTLNQLHFVAPLPGYLSRTSSTRDRVSSLVGLSLFLFFPDSKYLQIILSSPASLFRTITPLFTLHRKLLFRRRFVEGRFLLL